MVIVIAAKISRMRGRNELFGRQWRFSWYNMGLVGSMVLQAINR